MCRDLIKTCLMTDFCSNVLHFEDEEEFPDLLGASGETGVHSGSAATPFLSYSDILKRQGVGAPCSLFGEDHIDLS